jgi:2-polyprenyl-3-methyl-5-hydroxy-6-metoxy-1,4-benzoquinol methylase
VYLWRSRGIRSYTTDIQIIDPDIVKSHAIVPGRIWDSLGKVKDGDWDMNLYPINETDVFFSLKEHFIESVPWRECDYYKRVSEQVRNGEVKWGCKTQAQVDKRFEDIDQLFRDIKAHGFLSVEQRSATKYNIPFYDDVLVCIGRNGEYILHDGRHRIILAKILGLQCIPVRVTFRHSEWVRFSNEVRTYADRHGKLHAPITHQDLANIPSSLDVVQFLTIKENLTFNHGTVLDIGSHWGYFCHKLEAEGFDCYAMEADRESLYFLRKLKIAENRRFTILPCDLFDYGSDKKFDIVLAFDVFHNYMKNKIELEKLKQCLNRMNMSVMFLSSHEFDELQMQDSSVTLKPDELADFVLANSVLDKKRLIWKDKVGKSLYLLH